MTMDTQVEDSQPGTAALQEMQWFPVYPDKFFSSRKYRAMKDFQRGWYWHLLLECTRSKPLGYLPLDGQLWSLAGARSSQFWSANSELVLACFKVREFDGQEWIYSETLVKVLHEQQQKRTNLVKRSKLRHTSSSSSISYSDEFEQIWKQDVWKRVGKKAAERAFEKAIEVVLREQQPGVPEAMKNRAFAVGWLAQTMRAFKDSDSGRDHGLWDGYMAPHPASWLNGQRFFDDQKQWNKAPAGHVTESGAVLGKGYVPLKKKTEE